MNRVVREVSGKRMFLNDQSCGWDHEEAGNWRGLEPGWTEKLNQVPGRRKRLRKSVF